MVDEARDVSTMGVVTALSSRKGISVLADPKCCDVLFQISYKILEQSKKRYR